MKHEKNRVREDWTNMALADWADITPAELMDRMVAGWNQSYSDFMNARPSDWWDRMYGSGLRERMPWMRDWQERRPRRHHECTCGAHDDYDEHKKRDHEPCRRCGTSSCECICCLGDVDLAIYTHVGEQRVIQLVIENERHRDKEISLELSNWTTRGGSPAPVDTVLLEPKTFALESCAEQQVSLIVRVGAARQTEGGTSDAPTHDTLPGGDIAVERQSKLPLDVDDCLIATADLRLVGCDHRPLRIAVAILPRDCDPYRVTCGCTCC